MIQNQLLAVTPQGAYVPVAVRDDSLAGTVTDIYRRSRHIAGRVADRAGAIARTVVDTARELPYQHHRVRDVTPKATAVSYLEEMAGASIANLTSTVMSRDSPVYVELSGWAGDEHVIEHDGRYFLPHMTEEGIGFREVSEEYAFETEKRFSARNLIYSTLAIAILAAPFGAAGVSAQDDDGIEVITTSAQSASEYDSGVDQVLGSADVSDIAGALDIDAAMIQELFDTTVSYGEYDDEVVYALGPNPDIQTPSSFEIRYMSNNTEQWRPGWSVDLSRRDVTLSDLVSGNVDGFNPGDYTLIVTEYEPTSTLGAFVIHDSVMDNIRQGRYAIEDVVSWYNPGAGDGVAEKGPVVAIRQPAEKAAPPASTPQQTPDRTQQAPVPQPGQDKTPDQRPTATRTPTYTPTVTQTPTKPTDTPTLTTTPTPDETPTITHTPTRTHTPTPDETPDKTCTPQPTSTPKHKKQHFNQGRGNGPDGGDPGNSNNRRPSNDEGPVNRGGQNVP